MNKAVLVFVVCYVLGAFAQVPPTWCTMETGWLAPPFKADVDDDFQIAPEYFDEWLVGSVTGWIQAPTEIIEEVVCDMYQAWKWVDVDRPMAVLQNNQLRYQNPVVGDWTLLESQCKFGPTSGFVELTENLEWMGMPMGMYTITFKALDPFGEATFATYTYYISPFFSDAVAEVLSSMNVVMDEDTVATMVEESAYTELGRIATLAYEAAENTWECLNDD